MTDNMEKFWARQLSFTQWEFLADHFAGPRPIIATESRTRLPLISRGMIRCDLNSEPKTTVLTEKGHSVMCAAMGMMADSLIAMGFDGISNPKDREPKPMERYAYGKCTETTSRAPDGKPSALAQYRS